MSTVDDPQRVVYAGVIGAARRRLGLPVSSAPTQGFGPNRHEDLVDFLASWDGPGVSREDLVRYAVDWLSATP